MTETITRLEVLLKRGIDNISRSSEAELSKRTAPEKWSKKEILGHLIDSAVNNLQRFTEIQFENKPYKIKNYSQLGLVKANNYQDAEISELLSCWLALNSRIIYVIRQQNKITLNYKIELQENNLSDLRFLINDYVDHLEHHLKQIIG